MSLLLHSRHFLIILLFLFPISMQTICKDLRVSTEIQGKAIYKKKESARTIKIRENQLKSILENKEMNQDNLELGAGLIRSSTRLHGNAHFLKDTSFPGILNLEQKERLTAIELQNSPSLLDLPFIPYLPHLSLFFFLSLILWSKKTILARFLMLFLFILPSFLFFLNSQKFQVEKRIEEEALFEIRQRLQRDWLNIKKSRSKIEESVKKDIEETKLVVFQKISELERAGVNMKRNIWPRGEHRCFEKPASEPDKFLQKIAHTRGIHMILANDTTTFLDPFLSCSAASDLSSMVQKLIRLELLPNETIKPEMMKGFLSLIRSLDKIMIDPSTLYEFMNNPGRISDDNPSNFREIGYRREKSFWSYFLQTTPRLQGWFIMGSVEEILIYRLLKEQIERIKKHSDFKLPWKALYLSEARDLDWEPHPYSKTIPTQFSDPNRFKSFQMASYFKSGVPYLALSRSFNILKDSQLVLELPLANYVQLVRERKNRVAKLVMLSIMLLIILSIIFSRSITNPVFRLTDRMLEIGKGDCEKDLKASGSDLIARLARHLNTLSASIREKQRIEGFLSSMAMHAVSMEQEKPRREFMVVFFIGWSNLPKLQEASGENFPRLLEKVTDLLDTAFSGAGGSLDKFTGLSFLCLLPIESKNELTHILELLKMSLQAFSLNLYKDYGVDSHFSIGISEGSLVLGAVGSPGRKDFTAIGNTVNVGARLQKLSLDTAPDSLVPICALKDLSDVLPEQWSRQDLEKIYVKGKNEPLDVVLLS